MKDWSSFVPPFQWSQENLHLKMLDDNSDHLSCKFPDLHHQYIWKHKNASTNLEEWEERSQLFRKCARENKLIIPFVWHATIHTVATFLKYYHLKMYLLITYARNKLHRSRERERVGGDSGIKFRFVLSA